MMRSSKRFKGGFRRRTKRLRGRSRLSRAIRRTVLKMAEPKKTQVDFGLTQLYHNSGSPASGQIIVGQTILPSLLPGQGPYDSQRIGDQIYSKGIGMKFLLGLKADRHNCTFRIIVWKGAKDSVPTAYNQLFEAVTNNVLLDSVNTDRGRVIINKRFKPKFVDVNAGTTTKEYTTTYKLWIPFRKLIKFNVNAGTTASVDEIVYFVFAYDAYGSLLTDNIAYHQAWGALYYRDP